MREVVRPLGCAKACSVLLLCMMKHKQVGPDLTPATDAVTHVQSHHMKQYVLLRAAQALSGVMSTGA